MASPRWPAGPRRRSGRLLPGRGDRLARPTLRARLQQHRRRRARDRRRRAGPRRPRHRAGPLLGAARRRGSFGAITALELELYPVESVYAGALFFPLERASEVLHRWAEWAPGTPEELTSVGRMLNLHHLMLSQGAARGGRRTRGDVRAGHRLAAAVGGAAPPRRCPRPPVREWRTARLARRAVPVLRRRHPDEPGGRRCDRTPRGRRPRGPLAVGRRPRLLQLRRAPHRHRDGLPARTSTGACRRSGPGTTPTTSSAQTTPCPPADRPACRSTRPGRRCRRAYSSKR